jgi:arsenite methyltransferase
MSTSITPPNVDVAELRTRVSDVYREVATAPHAEFHFETGRPLAERLGYDRADLDAVPAQALASFAGVGHHFDLAAIPRGATVVDLGSGSGTDAFVAARHTEGGPVIGFDMTQAQLDKARRLAREAGIRHVEFREGLIEELDLPNACADVVISNGVINLVPDKLAVFREVARVLKSGGRMAISDIVTAKPLTESITCDASLWAACIGGAAQEDAYLAAIEAAGLELGTVRENPEYRFLSKSAQGATKEFGVKSVSLVARRPTG